MQFSNGASSAWVAWWVLQNFPKDEVILLYHDPGAEHPDGKRFQREVSEFLDHPVIVRSHDKSLWELIEDKMCLPGFHMPYCTLMLKQNPAEEFYAELGEPYTLYVGFGADEWMRVQRSHVRAEALGKRSRFPLHELGMVGGDAKDIIRKEWGICLPEPYKYLEHNNCIPCFQGGKRHFVRVAKYYPEEFERACQMEELVGHTVFKDCTLRDLKKKWRHFINQQDIFEAIPCLCAD